METKPIKTKGKATEFDKNLGLRLKGKRLLRGMSQQDLAAETGLSFSANPKIQKALTVLLCRGYTTFVTPLI